MTRRAHTIVTMAAGLLMSTSIGFSQAQSGAGSREGGQNTTPSGQSSQSSGGSASLGSSARSGQNQSGQAVDQQVNQQLREIARDPNTAPDKLFVLHAAMGNQMEIELARQAEQKAQNAQVKQVAQQIRQDHEKAQQELQQTAQSLGVQLPQGLPEDKQQEVQILSSLPASEFEKHYICMMQADHAKDIIEYRSTAQNAKNSQVKSYAQSQIPALTMHRTHVDSAAMALGLPSSSSEAMPASGRIEGSGSGRTGDTSGSSMGGPSGSSSSAGSAGSSGIGNSSGSGTSGSSSGSSGSGAGSR